MSRAIHYVRIEATYIHDTEDAVCVLNSDGVRTWLPKSHTRCVDNEDWDDFDRNETVQLAINPWLLDKKEGLEDLVVDHEPEAYENDR